MLSHLTDKLFQVSMYTGQHSLQWFGIFYFSLTLHSFLTPYTGQDGRSTVTTRDLDDYSTAQSRHAVPCFSVQFPRQYSAVKFFPASATPTLSRKPFKLGLATLFSNLNTLIYLPTQAIWEVTSAITHFVGTTVLPCLAFHYWQLLFHASWLCFQMESEVNPCWTTAQKDKLSTR